MRRLLLGVLAGWLAASATLAWQPAAWSWWSWPYVYDEPSGDWYWLQPSDTQWAYGFAPAAGWATIGSSGLAHGWSFWLWPYAYDFDGGAWYFLERGDTQWCLNLRSGQWSTLGTPEAPAGMALIPGGTNSGTNLLATYESYDSVIYPETYVLSVNAFFMDSHEVTQALWDDVQNWATNHGYSFFSIERSAKGVTHPVTSVNWYDCVKWCNARSEKEGRTPAYYGDAAHGAVYRTGQLAVSNEWINWSQGYRLPTSAEWEYAARGGVASRRFPWRDSDTIQHTRANYHSGANPYDTSATQGYHPTYATDGFPYTSPVGAFPSNGFGLCDMAGNVDEWCSDWFPGHEGTARVLRGGSWGSFAVNCRVGLCRGSAPASGNGALGFRTVLPLGP